MDFGYFLRRLDQGCNVDPSKEAVVFEDQRVTYQEVRDRSYRLANALSSLGVSKGDRVAVLLKNGSEWFDIFFAVAGLGAVMVPVNFLLKSKEVEFIVRDSGAKVLLVGEDLLPLVDPGSKETPELAHVICIGRADPPAHVLSYSGLTAEQKADPPAGDAPQADDLLLLQYTSGTTGFPKGAMHTQGTVLWNSFHQVGDFTVNAKDRYLCVPGLCWAAGFHDFTLATLWMGGTVVVMPSGGLEIGALLDIFQKERITKVLLVPSILKLVVDHPDLQAFDLSSLEFVASGAAPVPVTVIEQFNALLPASTLLQGYGLSEGPTIAICLKKEDAIRKIGSVGKPVTNCEALIVDESMNRVPPGTKGEIVLRSPATMKGYWNRPETNRDVFAEGWMRTGDMGEYDDEGYIYITGRIKDMYISGGLNVYPAEIENIILKDTGVAETAVIGIPDERWGEVGCAIIVPKEGAAVATREIEARCKEELAGYKVPKKYILQSEPLPRTASGKVKKFELQESYKS
jgi:fatty-acyl-CoA synthase